MPTKTRERKSSAENDKRMEELKRLIAMQDTKFEEANAKITAANQKMEGHDAKIDTLGTKIDLFQETCDLVITKQVEESVATMERDVDDLIGFRVAEKFDDLAKQDNDETAANIFDSVQGQVAEQVQSEIAVVQLETTALAKQCLENMET
jgi:uncharacterized coiled-coil protein SlyX